MEWMLLPLKRYAEFGGRSRRKEYWLFMLAVVIFYFVFSFLIGLLFGAGAAADGQAVNTGLMGGGLLVTGLFVLVVLALLVPSIAVQVRRFHDQEKSGLLVLLNFVPIVGGIIVLVFMCLPGTVGPNRYGPDPLEGDRVLTESPTTY